MSVNQVSEIRNVIGMSDAELIREAKARIYNAGYVIIKNFGIYALSVNKKKDKLYSVLSKLGNITTHDGATYFWDIMHRGDDYVKNNVTTFSEEIGECPLHTDSSFKNKPEDFLVMYVMQPAEKGGDSIYLSANSVIKQLSKSHQGRECLTILKRKIFPFRTPCSFNPSTPTIYESILSEDELVIRYRRDCIENGLSKDDINYDLINKGIDTFEKALKETDEKIIFSAQKDDLIIVDNTRGLHSRTYFDDTRRHFIRARVTEKKNG